MSIVLAWLRIDLRRRWRSLAVLTLLIVLAAATVMTSLAGARRGASTLERLSDRTLPATALVLPNTPGFDWSGIERLPEVAALTKFIVDDMISFEGILPGGQGFPPVDAAYGTTIEKPVLFAGRNYNPARDDEVVVTPRFVEFYHKGIGDTVVLDLPTAKQLADESNGEDSEKLLGPHIRTRIVGVVLSPWALDADIPGGPGGILMSPGVVARYPAETLGDQHNPANSHYVNALVRLRGGEADIPQLRRDMAKVTGRSDIEITSLPAQYREGQRQITFEARCLLAFALAVFVAGLFLIGQAIARYAAASADELQTMRALGMTPRQAVATAAAGPTISGIIAAFLAFGAALIASQWMPIGTASTIEPSRGLALDWVVLGPGVVIVAVLVSFAAVAAASLALSAQRRGSAKRRSAVAKAAARAGLPVPVVIGTRFALESGRGRTAVPIRPALVGAVTGVLGVLAAFTFSHGVSDASNHPERFGQTYQLATFMGFNNQEFGSSGKLVAALRSNPDVQGVDDAPTAVATGADGHASVSLYAYDSGEKALPVVVISGHMPASADEVVLAPRTLSALHTKVGARVLLRGEKQVHSYLVTGTGLVPAGPHNEYADGGWLTPDGYKSLFSGFKFHFVFVTLTPAARTPDAAATLAAAVAKADPTLKGVSFSVPDPPPAIQQLRQVRVLPGLLGAFLVVLAVGAVGHALATAVRRRSHDLAVLRALGMTQWQCRRVVITQATVLAVVGLIFGVPLGLAIGRSVWRVVADYTPLQYVPPFALWAMVLVVPAALLLANLLAAWPGQRAARLRVAQILRAE
jgi:hypothetical protein